MIKLSFPKTSQVLKITNTDHKAANLIARYMGRMANRGKVWTLIMIVIKAMYRSTLMKPEIKKKSTIRSENR